MSLSLEELQEVFDEMRIGNVVITMTVGTNVTATTLAEQIIALLNQ